MVYVEVNGIGYEVNVSLNTYEDISNQEEGQLFIYLQIKEDAHTMYGFSKMEEKDMFVQLISVSGVGAATARMMLSGMKPEEITNAVLMGNHKLLQSIKGIGKKTAERLVLELKDKLGKGGGTVAAGEMSNPISNLNIDAVNALMALGISHPVAESAIRKVRAADKEINQLEELIKKALKNI